MSFKFGRQWSVPHGPPPACKAAMACADHWLVESHIGRERWAVQMDDVCITLVGKFGDRLACLCDCFIAIGRPIARQVRDHQRATVRSEEHTSELQSLMRISYAVFCLQK